MPNTSANPLAELDFQNRFNIGYRSILSSIEGGRSENQDNYLIIDSQGQARFMHHQQATSQQLSTEQWSTGHIRLAVLDGMGGHDHGREAAESVVKELLALAPCHSVDELSQAIDAIHTKLNQQWSQDKKTPGTTLTLLEIPAQGDALLYHVGDSRLLEITRTQTNVLTIDHVPATQSAIHGKLDEANWKQQVWYEDRYIIRQAMIMGNSLYAPLRMDMTLSPDLYPLIGDKLIQAPFLSDKADRRVVKLNSGSVYLLATDGLLTHEYPWDFLQAIPEFIFSGNPRPMSARVDDIVMELILAADEEIGGDNTTVIGFEMVKPV